MSAILLFALALAADPSPPDIPRAVRDLGSDNYFTREKATKLLWAIGPPAEAALRDALKSNDPEVVARARRVLDLVTAGLRPEDPRRLLELAAALRAEPETWNVAVGQLLDLGPRGLEIARSLAENLPGPDQAKANRRQQIDAQGHRLTPALIAAGRDDEAEQTLERAARAAPEVDDVPARALAAFLYTRGKLDDRWPRWREQFEKDGNDRVAAKVVWALARLKGENVVARAAAKALPVDALEAVQFDEGAWAELSEVKPANLQNSTYAAAEVGLRIHYHLLAGDVAKSDDALAELRKLPVGTLRFPAPPLVFQAFMYTRHPDEALAALGKAPSRESVAVHFEILAQLRRDAEAFALIEPMPPAHTPARWALDGARLRVFQTRGETDKFDEVLKVARLDRAGPAELTALTDFVEQLAGMGREEETLPFVAALIAGGAKVSEVFEKAVPKTPLAYEAWWTLLRRERAEESPSATATRLPALCDARLREPANKARLATAEAAARAQPGDEGERLLRGLGEACQAAGLDDDAIRLYTEAARRAPSAGGWVKLGDLHAERDRWAEAADAFEHAAQADVKVPLPLWLAGWARAKAGRADGPEWMSRAHAILLADEDARIKFADEVIKRSHLGPEPGEAARYERRLVLRLGKLSSTPARTAQSQLSADALAFPDRLEAASATDRFLARMLRSISYFKSPTAYLGVLVRRDLQRAAGQLAKGEFDAAIKAAESALELLPANPTPACLVVPGLTKAGRTADADKLYAATATAIDKLIADHPRGSTFKANRAWLAARCRRDLDAAVSLAQKATELAPKDAGAWETLAEVRLQRGESADAATAAKKCVELSPRSAYYAKYLVRATAGD
ncbi:MAG: hypothetical protein U0746_09465 [Gemmataceae bacterium]